VKFTPPGGKIGLSVVPAPHHQVEFHVKDSGVGIAPEMLPRVFDLFSQGAQALDRSQGGLGIGLTLVKRLVELHGGTVSAFSDGLGRGSEFVVGLPALAEAPAAPPATEKQPAQVDVPARNLLIVDDNPDAAESLAALLQLGGHSVRIAPNGQLAIQAAQASVPDVVLLDIGLPGMDGYTVASQLRKLPGMDKALLVAVTGYGRDEDRRRSQEAGFDQHLVKPVDIDQLQQLLRTLPKE
jgi:two-component system CheB/CheR fusion protein